MQMKTLMEGIAACIGLQFIFISLVLFYRSSGRERLLGCLGLLLSLSFLQPSLQPYVLDNALLIFLFAGKKVVLIPVLLYLYLSWDLVQLKTKYQHFIFPSVYILGFYILQLGFTRFYLEYRFEFRMLHMLTMVIYFSIYWWRGTIVLEKDLSRLFRRKELDKYRRFYHSFNAVEFLVFLGLGATLLLQHSLSDYFKNLYTQMVRAVLFFSFVWGTLALWFFLSESNFFKTRTLRKHYLLPYNLSRRSDSIEHAISKILHVEKHYKNPHFDVEVLAEEAGCSKRLVSSYFQEAKGESFQNYLNGLRIQEFKEVAKTYKSLYDIEGMLKLSGFASRATFYRVFKKHSGMTPKQYLETIK